MARSLVLKAKITPKDIDNPKKIAALDDSVQTFTLGNIIGIANEIVERTMPKTNGDVETFYGLGGMFKAIPADETRDVIQSAVLFLPSVGILEHVESALKDGETDIRFAFEVAVRRANNPAGYEWIFKPLTEPNVAPSDPLSIFEAEINERIALAKSQTPLAIANAPSVEAAPADAKKKAAKAS